MNNNNNELQFTIHRTEVYSKFKHFQFNRELNEQNKNKIKESIKENGLLMPICVTSDGYIYDGQHRFFALRELGLPVDFVVNHNAKSEDIYETNNVRKGWNTRDYVWYNANRGSFHCKRLLELYDEWTHIFPNSESVINTAYTIQGGSVATLIKNDAYEVNEEFGDALLNNAIEINKAQPGTLVLHMIRALRLIMLKNEDFDINILLRNLEKRRLHIYQNSSDTRESITDVYNYKRRKNLVV